MTKEDELVEHIKLLVQSQQEESSKEKTARLESLLNRRGLRGVVRIKNVWGN